MSKLNNNMKKKKKKKKKLGLLLYLETDTHPINNSIARPLPSTSAQVETSTRGDLAWEGTWPRLLKMRAWRESTWYSVSCLDHFQRYIAFSRCYVILTKAISTKLSFQIQLYKKKKTNEIVMTCAKYARRQAHAKTHCRLVAVVLLPVKTAIKNINRCLTDVHFAKPISAIESTGPRCIPLILMLWKIPTQKKTIKCAIVEVYL